MRDRAAMALVRRKGEQPVAALVKMLSATRLETRYGACVLKGTATLTVGGCQLIGKNRITTETKNSASGSNSSSRVAWRL